jgi:DNA-binding MarR family transcriptional regulator
MDAALPLSSLLSQALVAFTIEFDNEAERRLPHRTTSYGIASTGGAPAPWLVSLVMWSNCMRFVDEHGITIRELERAARTPTNLAGMQRWGYIVIGPGQGGAPKWARVVRPTAAGIAAKQVWGPLVAEVEERWRQRFGTSLLARLCEALDALAARLDAALPDCMPILGYGMRNAERLTKLPPAEARMPGDRALPGGLAKVLLAFALEFESGYDVSLAICANLLRILDESPAPVRDLPERSGVSKEALRMAIGILTKQKLLAPAFDSSTGSRRAVRLTPEGLVLRRRYRARLENVEADWETRFGAEPLRTLRGSLEELAGDPGRSPLLRGLEPHADGWRAKVPRPAGLPHFPMVLHRGGFPDGS